MSNNRFYTLLVVPEKTDRVRRIVLPSWVIRGSLVALVIVGIFSAILMMDYWYIASQVGENKKLKAENRRLRQQTQLYQSRISTIESNLERIKTFSTRLKVITNIEDRDSLLQSIRQKLPDASQNIGQATPPPSLVDSIDPSQPTHWIDSVLFPDETPEQAQLRKDTQELDQVFGKLYHDALFLEQTLQDQYELLADQKAFLGALPTRRPAVGYFTSGFGIRRSPYGGREKMHEGLDIANYPGTQIKSTAEGTVIYAAPKPGYGQTVILDHGYGLQTWYAHCSKIVAKKGQKIRRGEIIALLGNSGRSTGPHLHYEVRVHGTPVDPLTYILEN